MYQARKASRSEFVPIRTLRYHVRLWGEPAADKVPLVMLHGWMDVSASFQFVVDALARDHYVIAPDWRGFGLTEVPTADNFWFPDYLADLDFLLDHYSPHAPVDLVGHSMGGNAAMLYAGSRPARIRKLINLEGFGMPRTDPAQAPQRYAQWMDELKRYHQGDLQLKPYPSAQAVAQRLMKTNPRLSQDKAEWLARHWARQQPDGSWSILGHSAHKIVSAQLYRVDEALEIYRRTTAPTLFVEAAEPQPWRKAHTGEYNERLRQVLDLRHEVLEDAAHMLHHDQPQRLAQLIEDFLVA